MLLTNSPEDHSKTINSDTGTACTVPRRAPSNLLFRPRESSWSVENLATPRPRTFDVKSTLRTPRLYTRTRYSVTFEALLRSLRVSSRTFHSRPEDGVHACDVVVSQYWSPFPCNETLQMRSSVQYLTGVICSSQDIPDGRLLCKTAAPQKLIDSSQRAHHQSHQCMGEDEKDQFRAAMLSALTSARRCSTSF